MLEFHDIKWLILDVDGVMTDGRLLYSSSGEEYKIFNVKDGLGIHNLKRAGIRVAVISGRGCAALMVRLNELAIDEKIINRPDKGKVFDELYKKYGDELLDSICVGDDLPDLELFSRCKYGAAVSDAVSEVKASADLVLHSAGGQGAVRELCDSICSSLQLARNSL